jgi:hypothetical protein
MTDKPARPFLIGYLALFAGIYLVLLLLAGLLKTCFSLKMDLNAPILLTTGIIVSSLFTVRHRRLLSGAEIIKLSLGAFAIDLVFQLGITLILTQDYAVLASWLIWLILLLHLIGLFFAFGYISTIIGKSFLEAMTKKTQNQPPGDTR